MPLSVTLKSETNLRFLSYWDDLRGDRLMPARSELDPASIKPILPFLAIGEFRTPSELIVRLAGTALRDMLGVELTGRNLLDISAPEDRRERGWRFWQTATHPCGSFYRMPLTFAHGASGWHEGLSLPIKADRADGPPMLVGIFGPMAGSHWLNASQVAPIDLAPSFEFFEIGAGLPPQMPPPDSYIL